MGREVARRQALVGLGGLDRRRQRQRAEPAQAEGGARVGAARVLSGVGGERLLEPRKLGRDVHQQIGGERPVDLVEQHGEGLGDGRQIVAGADRAERPRDGREGGPMVLRHLLGARSEQEARPRGGERPADRRRRLVDARGERAVGQLRAVDSGDAQPPRGLGRFGPPPGGVGGPVGRWFAGDAARRGIGEEEHPHGGAPVHELEQEATAAERLVVVVRRHDERARRLDGGRLARRELGSAHGGRGRRARGGS